MKFSKLIRAVVCALALALIAGNVFAAKKKEENDYPNATRKEPKLEMSERNQRDLNKAMDFINEEKMDEAAPLVQKVLADDRASKYARALALQAEGQMAYDKEDYDGAIIKFKETYALDALSNNAQFQVLYQVAQLQVMQEKYQEALSTLQEWFKVTGAEKADAYALQANINYRLEKFQDAINTMKKALALSDKPNESWMQILMASYFELDQYDEAALLAEQQLAKNPTDKKLINQIATIYIQGDKPQKAIDLLTRVKEQGLINTQDDYMQLAKLYASADKPKEAAATLKEGLDKNIIQPSYEVYKLHGDVCVQAEDDACAIDAYSKASPLAKDGNTDYQLGYLLFYSNRSKEAKEVLTRAITKGGLRQEGEAYVLRGDTENDLNETQAALADWQKATQFSSSKAMAEQRIKAAQSGVKIQKSKKK